jgi:hypothetical protein
LNHHLRVIAEKHIIFDDQYHGHQNCFCRDNQNRDYSSSSCRDHGYWSPSERYQGQGILAPKQKVPSVLKFS